MSGYVLDLQDIDRTQTSVAGGKGANLGELTRMADIRVPPGFCVTTGAFRRVVAEALVFRSSLDRLSRQHAGDHAAIRTLCDEIRACIESLAIPDDISLSVATAYGALGSGVRVAVRSSATAEDLPNASFAGQQDTFLNISGVESVLRHIRRCWGSLFTERAVTYRMRNGFDHHRVAMAVVVQQMVDADASGVLFTADPVSGNRRITVVEAVAGLGEVLVSGHVNPDTWQVRGDAIIESGSARDRETALTHTQVVRLAALGRRIEAHFGQPQDIEWCLADDGFYIVQSRPITTLFPVPSSGDGGNHVYVSVGHQQMMTDPLKPLGLSFWQMTTPRPMAEAGGRLFVDVTPMLASSASRAGLLDALGRSDPLIRDALETVLDRGDFIPPAPEGGPAWTPPGGGSDAIETDPSIPAALVDRTRASLAALEREIATKAGVALLDFIESDMQEMRRIQSDPRSMQVVMAGMQAAWWLNEKLEAWLGERNVADTLSQSVPDNITSEMGLALLDVADAVRPHQDAVAYMESVNDDDFLDDLSSVKGGREAQSAIREWLSRYGMRGVGEIDITRPRWGERPAMLIPIILGNVRNFQPGEARRRFERGEREAREKERDLLKRLRDLPDGEAKADETKRMIDRVRTFAGYREFPKYAMVSRYYIYKQALMTEAARLVSAGVLRSPEDICYLRFDELREVLRTQQVDAALIAERREAFKAHESLTPPRVLTSDGEMLSGSYRRGELPPGALAGLAVSAGVVEGRARVVLDVASANLEAGDILVTRFTDPSWTPLFVTITALVTEVGGLMTHGAVIAREYGVPAVVGVADATTLIQEGQRIRVHGTDGYIEILG